MKKGFTLIELSIVLVIIGLIVGGVLVGQALIYASELRSINTQMQEYQTAVTTFKLKYNCFPGDCPNATTFGLTGNGNGDKRSQYGAEALRTWKHLREANLIAGQYDGLWDGDVRIVESYPQSYFRDNIGWRLYNYGGTPTGYYEHYPPYRQFMRLMTATTGSYHSGWNSLNPTDAKKVDEKTDDGKPYTGSILVRDYIHCATGAGNYDTSKTGKNCNPSYLFDW